jgi:prepilin peptidase CpaA
MSLPNMTLPTATLATLLLAAVAFDLRSLRIPNAIVFPGMALALLLHALLPDGIGASSALAGLGIGLAGLLPLYALGAMGAGDVKLMAMAGAFLGPSGGAAALVLTFILGTFLAVAFALKRGAQRKADGSTAARVPYSLAIALGAVSWLLVRQL